MPSFLAGLVVALAVLAIAVQLALPAYLAGRVEDRLERGGGSANVELSAFPAFSLLAGRGGSFAATGTGLRFDPGERSRDSLGRLDGFDRVAVHLSHIDAGPLRVERFDLVRIGRGDDYRLSVDASSTPRALAGQLGNAAGGPLAGLLGELAGRFTPGTAIPLELAATVRSDDGRPHVAEATGSVAGVPAGPLARVVLALVLDRL